MSKCASLRVFLRQGQMAKRVVAPTVNKRDVDKCFKTIQTPRIHSLTSGGSDCGTIRIYRK